MWSKKCSRLLFKDGETLEMAAGWFCPTHLFYGRHEDGFVVVDKDSKRIMMWDKSVLRKQRKITLVKTDGVSKKRQTPGRRWSVRCRVAGGIEAKGS